MIAICPRCGEQEYEESLHWRDGRAVCRVCIYNQWEFDSDWRRGPKDYVFPLNKHGLDYSQMHTYYVSLCRGLRGYLVKFQAPHEQVVREHLLLYFGKMWSHIYRPEELQTIKCINEDAPIVIVRGEWE